MNLYIGTSVGWSDPGKDQETTTPATSSDHLFAKPTDPLTYARRAKFYRDRNGRGGALPASAGAGVQSSQGSFPDNSNNDASILRQLLNENDVNEAVNAARPFIRMV